MVNNEIKENWKLGNMDIAGSPVRLSGGCASLAHYLPEVIEIVRSMFNVEKVTNM